MTVDWVFPHWELKCTSCEQVASIILLQRVLSTEDLVLYWYSQNSPLHISVIKYKDTVVTKSSALDTEIKLDLYKSMMELA